MWALIAPTRRSRTRASNGLKERGGAPAALRLHHRHRHRRHHGHRGQQAVLLETGARRVSPHFIPKIMANAVSRPGRDPATA
jgi:hypothetical protein